MFDTVIYQQERGVARIVLNRPSRLNVVNPALAADLLAAVNVALEDQSTRVVILSGAGRAFMAGGDLAFFQSAGADAPEAAWELIEPLHRAIELLSGSDVVSIAAVHGACAGAGMSLALSTDLAIACRSAQFNMAYLGVGASPDCSGSWNLVRHAGLRRALGLLLLGDTMSADQALEAGLINRVVEDDQLAGAIDTIARRLADGPAGAIGATKRLVRAAGDASLREQLRDEGASFSKCAGTEDFREALAAFLEKRQPKFL